MLEKLQKKEEGKFLCAVCGNGGISNSNLCQFCKCQIHKRFCGIKGELKEDSEFEYQTCAIEETDIPEECPGIQLNGQSLEIVEKFCYCSHEIRAKARAVTNAIRKAKADGVSSEIQSLQE